MADDRPAPADNGVILQSNERSPSSGVSSPNGQLAPRRPPKSHQPLLVRLRPRLSTLLICLLTYRFGPRPLANSKRISKLVHWLTVWLAILNWRATPFYWHVMTLFPVAVVKFKRWRLGSDNKRFIKSLGVIGNTPFEAKTVSKHCATWNSCDFMIHMSNSSYAIALDEARCQWHVHMIGIAMRNDRENVRPLIASTHFAYFNEIPILADYQVEMRLVSWDTKWVYLLATFTTDPPKGSKTRVINCLSITRTVLKIGRRTVTPSKLFALSGLGKTETEWKSLLHSINHPNNHQNNKMNSKQKLSPSQEWLIDNESDLDVLNRYEDQRIKNLNIVRSALDGDSTLGVERLKEL